MPADAWGASRDRCLAIPIPVGGCEEVFHGERRRAPHVVVIDTFPSFVIGE